ncbi:MAG: prephenate dehydrogenase [Oscillospiraceae bacterium]|jgi:prephenate dehydrogenase
MKQIAIIGLGLIGGSLALALRGFEDYEIVGVARSEDTLAIAKERGAADILTKDAAAAIRQADVTILCLHPQGIVDFLKEHGADFQTGSLVTDVCGVKTAIMEAAEALPDTVDFIGGHPMAGRETSGMAHAEKTLFQGTHYLLTPREKSKPEHIALLRRMTDYLGCRDVVLTTPKQHDELIAYTSQVMHIMAAAVCDDPGLFSCRGFEGNSFRDCTRVAALDVPLWTQLFSMNASALCGKIQRLEENLKSYRETLASGDRKRLSEKLEYSANRKRQMNLD